MPPGAVASFKWRSKETRNIWLAYLNMQPARDRQAPPDTENCIKCHPLKGLMGIPGKIRMPHAKHINQNNLECVDCHDHTAHAAPGQSSAVSMAPCTMCHEQTQDSSKCDFCHYTPPVSGQSHPTDFLAEHGKLALANEQDCVRCHHNKAQFCDGCHSKPTPGHYSGNWPYAHGLQAKKDRTPLPRLPLGEAAVQPVPHRGPPGRLGDVARARGAQGRAVVPGVPPQADVHRLSRGRRSDHAMRPRTVVLVLLGAFCVLLAAAGPAAAVTFTIPTGESDRCLECHAKPDLGTVDVNGVEKSLTVSEDTWHSSMHSRLDCTACHAGFEAREHTPQETQGWYEQAKLTACSDCHASEFKMYDKSFHGNLVMNEGSTKAPACGDCHGSHGIIDPTSPGVPGDDPRGVRALPRREVGDVPRHLPRQVRRAWATCRGRCAPTVTATTRSCRSRTRTAP